MQNQFAVTHGDTELATFRASIIGDLRRIADELERGDEYVVVALATCDYEGNGGPIVMVDGDAATPELADEICDTLKNAMFEAL